MSRSGTALTPGTKFGSYEILSLLGVGAMAEVHLATDRRSGNEVALKVLPRAFARNDGRLRRFHREARLLSSTEHPNIVAIYEVGYHDRIPYIAMEYVEGATLRDLLEEGPLAIETVFHIARQIADGLASAHACGIVHRDLKPENIMLTQDDRVKILDFGLSKPLGPDGRDSDSAESTDALTLPGTILGTLDYMSPEQARGRGVDYRGDQFAFGAVLQEMLTGTPAFHRDTPGETLAAVIDGQPAPLDPRIPEGLRTLIERCLAKSPEQRYATMTDVSRGLEEVESTNPKPSRNWLTAVGGMFLAALAAAVSI